MYKMLTFTTFTDPMMGLSYECEPLYRKLETHYAQRIRFRYAMGVLVRDIHQFMVPEDYAGTPAETIANYNRRLAAIYESEEHIGGLPINMQGFRLFDEQHLSSEPLCLAYKTAQIVAPDLADRFLYRLRFATVMETRPTTHWTEIMRVVQLVGIDEQRFAECYHSAEAQEALQADVQLMHSLGIHALPACLLEYDGKCLLGNPLYGFEYMSQAISQLTNDALLPTEPLCDTVSLRALLQRHPLISLIELSEGFNLDSANSALTLLQPLLNDGEVMIPAQYGGQFIFPVE